MDVVATIIFILIVITHIAFAFGVFEDAQQLNDEQRKTYFVGEGVWALSTLIGGIFVAVCYWLLHHSAWSRLSTTTDTQINLSSESEESNTVNKDEADK